jgi:hypothetical protein
LDLLMVRDRSTGRFIYTERLERRSGETSWEYVRRSVRREARISTRFDRDAMEVIVGWDVDSVEEFCARTPSSAQTEAPMGRRGCKNTKDEWKEIPLTPHNHRRHLRSHRRKPYRRKSEEGRGGVRMTA